MNRALSPRPYLLGNNAGRKPTQRNMVFRTILPASSMYETGSLKRPDTPGIISPHSGFHPFYTAPFMERPLTRVPDKGGTTAPPGFSGYQINRDGAALLSLSIETHQADGCVVSFHNINNAATSAKHPGKPGAMLLPSDLTTRRTQRDYFIQVAPSKQSLFIPACDAPQREIEVQDAVGTH